MTLSPGQKKLLTYGVPIVAVLGIIMYLRSRSGGPQPGTGTTPAPAPSTSAIDAGQLAGFENNVQAQLSAFAGQISGLSGALSTQPPVTDPTQTPTQTGTTSVNTPSSPTPPAPGNTPPPPGPGLAVVSTPNYLGAVNPSGAFVDVGVATPSNTPTVWSTTPIAGGFQHEGAGGATYYAPAGAPPNTLPPGAVLPSWASSVEQYFASA